MGSMSGDGSSQRIELRIESHPANVAPARRTLEAFAAGCRFDETSRGEIGLCVNEALANVIRHAYRGQADRPIAISAECSGETLRITIRDWGCGINPMELPEREHDPLVPGGLGLICLRQLCDDLRFQRQADGMLLVMTRQRRRKGRADARDVG